MPRDISGNYTLPAGNPVVSGTVIATTWANPTLSDVGQNLTDSLDRFGRGGMLAALRLLDGSAVVPALAWSSETGSGLYRVGAGVVGMSVLAVEVGRFSAGQFSTVLGTAGAPSRSFTGDLNTGMYSPGADIIGFSCNGVESFRFNVGGARISLDGSAGSPSLAFLNSTGTGLFRAGADILGIATTSTERLRISSTGNVIINAPSSGEGLRVDGDIQIRKNTGSLLFRNAADTLNVGFMQFSDSSSAILSVTGAQDLAIQTNSSTRLAITSDGRVFGTALHNNGGSVTGTTNQYIASGTYVPTPTNGGNATTLSGEVCQWIRVGNVVTVGGAIVFGFTSASTATTVNIPLPISTTFVVNSSVGGAAARGNVSLPGLAGAILALPATANARLLVLSDANLGVSAWFFSFTYLIL